MVCVNHKLYIFLTGSHDTVYHTKTSMGGLGRIKPLQVKIVGKLKGTYNTGIDIKGLFFNCTTKQL